MFSFALKKKKRILMWKTGQMNERERERGSDRQEPGKNKPVILLSAPGGSNQTRGLVNGVAEHSNYNTMSTCSDA